MPAGDTDGYMTSQPGTELIHKVLDGKDPHDFVTHLASRFKSVSINEIAAIIQNFSMVMV